MIRIKPAFHEEFTCPSCGSTDAHLLAISIPGMTIAAEYQCQNCQFKFLVVLPIGHTSDYTVFISCKTKEIFQKEKNPEWLNEIISSSITKKDESVTIRKTILYKAERIVLLNCLDYIYGHALLKLLNATYHLDHNHQFGLIILIPAALEWMAPKGCAEIWIVDLKVSDLKFGYFSIEKFINKELEKYDEVYLSKAYSHPDQTTINIKRFIEITPFDLRFFSIRIPHITFVLREDRWWYPSKLHYWFYRFCRLTGKLSWGSKMLVYEQNRLVKKTIKKIKQVLPDSKISIAGFGKTGHFDSTVNDKRSINVDVEIEKEWCHLYAHSQIVVGVHGSNMLLPTAFAAGCVEILPEERYKNMVQDLFVRYADRRQLFLYRIDDQYTTPSSLARKITSMILNFKRFERNMCKNSYTNYETASATINHTLNI